jgi:hypothetical protein
VPLDRHSSVIRHPSGEHFLADSRERHPLAAPNSPKLDTQLVGQQGAQRETER